MGILSIKTIGIDVYDMPLRAVNSDGEMLQKTNINLILKNIPTIAVYAEAIDEIIASKKYWGDFLLTQELLKYAINNLKSKLMRSKVLVCVPHDIANGRFGEIFKRMLQEAAMQAGGREAHLIENIYCAALGAGLPVKEHKKIWVMYSNDWCTYLYMTYGGATVMSEIIEKPHQQIHIEEITSIFKSMSIKPLVGISKLFGMLNLDAAVMDSLEINWLKPNEKKIHMIVPDSLKNRFGQWMEDYQLIYTDNYEDCIIEGLKYSVKEMNYIIKPKNRKNTFNVF